MYGVRILDLAITLWNWLYSDPQQCLVRCYRAPSISSLTFGNTGGIWLVSRPAKWSSPLCCWEPYRIRPIYSPFQLTILFYCINKSFLLLYLSYRDDLKQKTHKIATKAQTHSAVVTWINTISELIPDLVTSRFLPVRHMEDGPTLKRPCMKWLADVLTWNKSKHKQLVNKTGKRRPIYTYNWGEVTKSWEHTGGTEVLVR